MTIFETERLIVRQYTEEDKDNIFLLGGNEAVMRYIRPVNTREESYQFLLLLIYLPGHLPLFPYQHNRKKYNWVMH
jgi:hypothetical protein